MVCACTNPPPPLMSDRHPVYGPDPLSEPHHPPPLRGGPFPRRAGASFSVVRTSRRACCSSCSRAAHADVCGSLTVVAPEALMTSFCKLPKQDHEKISCSWQYTLPESRAGWLLWQILTRLLWHWHRYLHHLLSNWQRPLHQQLHSHSDIDEREFDCGDRVRRRASLRLQVSPMPSGMRLMVKTAGWADLCQLASAEVLTRPPNSGVTHFACCSLMTTIKQRMV